MKVKLRKICSLFLTVLMTISLVQINTIKNVRAATLHPEAKASVKVIAEGIDIRHIGAANMYNITLGGADGFCLAHGKSARSGNTYANVSTKVNSKINQVINWYKDNKSGGYGRDFYYGIAQATIWAIQSNKTSDTQIGQIYDDILHYYMPNAGGTGDDYMWAFYKDTNTGILSASTSGTYYAWDYGASSHQPIVPVSTPPNEFQPQIRNSDVSSTQSYSTSESIKVQINKSDFETTQKLSGVAFDFYKDNVKGGSSTTNESGIAEHTFTTEYSKSATATKEYCVNYNDLSLPNRALVTGYTSKSEAQTAANTEALAEAKRLALIGSGQEHTYKVIETRTKINYWLNPATNIYEKKYTGAGTIVFDITNTRQKGTITITKRDSETNNLVDQAVYGLYARSNIIHPDGKTGTLFTKDQLVATFPKTALDGTAKLNGLYLGQYYVKEITAPSGYLHSSDVYNVDLNYAGQNIEITDSSTTVKDKVQRAKVTAVKKDKELDNGTKNPDIFDLNKDGAQGDSTRVGATYGLYARENITHADGSTGVVTYNQIADSIHEIKAAKGTDLSVKNVRATAGTLLATIKTDSNGEFGFDHLYNGKYYIKEIAPSEGYTLDPTEYDVNLSYSNQNEQVVVKANKVLEQVKKQAFDLFKAGHVPGTSTNAKPLAGVEFTVWLESDIQSFIAKGKTLDEAKQLAPIYDKLITKVDGTASSIELPYGKYRVSETKPAIDYATADDFFVTVTEDNRVHQSFTNNVIIDELFTGLIQAIKLDKETGKQVLLEGAEFKIKNLDKNEYIGYWEWNPFPVYINSWSTNDQGYVRLQEKFEAGNYQLEEIHAPFGYVVDSTPIPFKITNQTMFEIAEDGKTPIIKTYKSDVSTKGKIQIEKQGEVLTAYDQDTKQFVYELRGLKDAEYDIFAKEDILDPSNDKSVLYAKDELVTSIKTDEDGKATSKELPLGSYYSKEKTAPNGYILSNEIKEFTLEYEDETVAIVYDQDTYINDRQKVSVEASKQDAGTKTYLPGAEISLYANRDVYNFDGEIIVSHDTLLETVTTDQNGKATFKTDLPNDICPEYAIMPINEFDDVDPGFNNNVVDGTKLVGDPNSLFVVYESKAPAGYIPFAVNYYIDTKYTTQNESVLKFETAFQNEQTITNFDKKDASTGKSINQGGEYQIIDPVTNKVMTDWIGDGQIHIEKGLIFEKEYIWHEVKAPDGFALAEDVKFIVSKDGTIIMKDNPLLTIEKLDKIDNFFVPGNELELREADTNKLIQNIVTTDKAIVLDNLVTGKDYILKETKQAEGYYINKEELRFTFVPGMTVKFYNNPIMTDIKANKLDSQTMQPVLSADFEFTMYSDPECTNIVRKVNANTFDGTATFTDVRYGVWYIKETKAPPGYKLSDEVKKVVVNDNLDGVGDMYSFVYLNTLLPVVVIEEPKTNDSTMIMSFAILSLGSFVGIFLSRKKKKEIVDDE